MKNRENRTLVIGGGYPQNSLMEALVELGQEITVIDDRENIPAHTVTDDVVSINRYDVKGILAFAEENPPQYVASGGNDNAVHFMTLIAEHLGLPSYISSETSQWPMKKGAVRKLLDNNDIPVPRTYEINSLEDAQALDWNSMRFPVVIKPDEGIGQTGVDKANSPGEAISSIEEAFGVTRNNRVLLQEFIEGQEVSLNGIVVDGCFKLLTTSCRNSSRDRGGAFGVAMEKVYPAITDKSKLSEIEEMVNKACQLMEIENGPIYAQTIVDEDENVFIIEIMPRLGGGEDPRAVKAATGFDLSKATAQLCIGETIDKPDFSISRDTPKAVVLRFLKIAAGTIRSIKGVMEAYDLPGVEKIEIFFREGDSVGELKTSRQRVGYILARGDSTEEASSRADAAEDTIKIAVDAE